MPFSEEQRDNLLYHLRQALRLQEGSSVEVDREDADTVHPIFVAHLRDLVSLREFKGHTRLGVKRSVLTPIAGLLDLYLPGGNIRAGEINKVWAWMETGVLPEVAGEGEALEEGDRLGYDDGTAQVTPEIADAIRLLQGMMSKQFPPSRDQSRLGPSRPLASEGGDRVQRSPAPRISAEPFYSSFPAGTDSQEAGFDQNELPRQGRRRGRQALSVEDVLGKAGGSTGRGGTSSVTDPQAAYFFRQALQSYPSVLAWQRNQGWKGQRNVTEGACLAGAIDHLAAENGGYEATTNLMSMEMLVRRLQGIVLAEHDPRDGWSTAAAWMEPIAGTSLPVNPVALRDVLKTAAQLRSAQGKAGDGKDGRGKGKGGARGENDE